MTGRLDGFRRRVGRHGGALAHQAVARVGGPARLRVVVVLAAVLALDAADHGAVGAMAVQLESGLHIGDTAIGLMVTVSSLVSAVATIPMGMLVDRVTRVRLLSGSIVVWAVAELASGVVPGYDYLLAARVFLGLAVATAGPAVASLTGDLVPPNERGRIWGYILTGEVLGTGAGVLYAGMFSSALSWRAGFLALVVPSLGVAWLVHRLLPEPARGGASRVTEGADTIRSAEEVAEDERRHRRPRRAPRPQPGGDVGLWGAVRYVLGIRTNVILIVSSSLGYFFLSGLETFALIYLRGRFGLGTGTATLVVLAVGAAVIAGLLLAGHLGDRWVHRGRIGTRIVIGAGGYAVAAVVLAPALATATLGVALPLLLVAGLALSAPNPGLDAARLDVVVPPLWGRSEAVRTLLRQSLQGLAPLIFGVVSQAFGAPATGIGAGAGVGTSGAAPTNETAALQLTFLVMLVPLLVAGRRPAGGAPQLPGRRGDGPATDGAGRRDTCVGGGTGG